MNKSIIGLVLTEKITPGGPLNLIFTVFCLGIYQRPNYLAEAAQYGGSIVVTESLYAELSSIQRISKRR